MLNIEAIYTSSYHEFGQVENAQIKTGRIVIENSEAKIENMLLVAKSDKSGFEDIIVETKAGAELPALDRTDVDIASTGTLVVNVVTPSTDEFIYLTKAGVVEQIVVTEAKQADVSGVAANVANKSSTTQTAAAQVANVGKKNADGDYVDSNNNVIIYANGTVAEGKDPSNIATEEKASQEDISTGTTYFAGGAGTEKSPYLISNDDEWKAISDLFNPYSKPYYFKQVADIQVSDSVKYFSGEYDGNGHNISTSKKLGGNYNFYFLFGNVSDNGTNPQNKFMRGHVTIKNINVNMNSTYATVLFYFVDWNTSYGLDVENVSFNANENINVGWNNFGFITLQAIQIPEGSSATYNFKNITSNVNLTNSGTCTGFIVGSGPHAKPNSSLTLNYDNCVNNGTICGTSSVGFLYGNSNDLTDAGTLNITVNNCENNGAFMSTANNANVHFAPYNNSAIDDNKELVNSLNNNYETGAYLATNALSNVTVKLSQSGSTFTVYTTAAAEYNYKLALSVATTNNPGGTIASGVKYFFDVETGSEDNDHYSFYAYDVDTAMSKGIITSESEVSFGTNNAGIITKNNINYLIVKFTNGCTIDSSVSVIVYAYSGDTLVGIK